MLHRHLSDGAVVFGISAVHVAHHASAEQRMVEACVELLEVFLVLAFHADASESFPPNHLRGVTCLVEAHASCLCLEVNAGVLHRSVADADLCRYLLALLRIIIKVGTCSEAMRVGLVLVDLLAVEGAVGVCFLVHDSREINALVGIRLVFLDVFRACDDVSLDGAVLVNPHLRVLHLAALALLMTDVEDKMRGRGLGEREAKVGDALGCRHLGIDAVVLEHNLIIACCSIFFLMTEGRAVALGACAVGKTGDGAQLACRRSNGNAAHLELVGADETLDGRVAIVVAGCLPAVGIAERAVG